MSEWISVEDRLPESMMTDCACIINSGEIVIGSYNNDRDYWACHSAGSGNKVTHWMPLPPPPK